jgi:hypothetical protein
MTAKQVLFRTDAREKVLRGATRLADAIRITLGPKSKSVLITSRSRAASGCLSMIRMRLLKRSQSRQATSCGTPQS